MVQFISLADNQTRVELEHRGPELIGDLWVQRVNIFNAAWAAVLSKLQLFLTNISTQVNRTSLSGQSDTAGARISC